VKIERDKVYVTRGGHKRRVVAVDAPGRYPVVTVGVGTSDEGVELHCANGRISKEWEDFQDLVKEYREPKVLYVNEYKDGSGFAHTSRLDAQSMPRSRIERVAVKYVEVVEE
jgi:hypothetical protein